MQAFNLKLNSSEFSTAEEPMSPKLLIKRVESSEDIDIYLAKNNKRNYIQVEVDKRKDLILLLQNTQLTIKEAAKELKVNYSTAKNIVKVFRDTGRIDKIPRRRNLGLFAVKNGSPEYEEEKRILQTKRKCTDNLSEELTAHSLQKSEPLESNDSSSKNSENILSPMQSQFAAQALMLLQSIKNQTQQVVHTNTQGGLTSLQAFINRFSPLQTQPQITLSVPENKEKSKQMITLPLPVGITNKSPHSRVNTNNTNCQQTNKTVRFFSNQDPNKLPIFSIFG